MELRETDREILERAMAAFQQATGTRVHLKQWEPKVGDFRIDARVRFDFPQTHKEWYVEVKRTLDPQTLGMAVEQIKRIPEKTLLVTRYVNPNMAERLRQMAIPFLDTLGNAYLNDPPAYVYIQGNAPQRFPREAPTRAFAPAGLRVVFALLCRQELAGAPFRTIAQTANVALGTVAWVLGDLEALGHLVDMGKRGRKLVNKQRLLERWVEAYPNQLRPKLFLGRCATEDPEWWKHAHIADFHACWGGEPAAALLTGHLKPEAATVYTRNPAGKFLAANRLRTDPRGNVELLKTFWDPTLDWTKPEIAPPLLVYADLLATGDPRNIETARRIYDEQLARLVRED